MSRTITIAGIDRTSATRLDEFAFVECAWRGEVGMGSLVVDDEAGNITIPALKTVTVDESASSDTRLFTGFTTDRAIRRGPYKTGASRQWDVTVIDINTMFDDRVLSGSGANRPQETDFARITWLLSTAALGSMSAGTVISGGNVTMDPADYRGRYARDVLSECAEKAGKNFFAYDYDGTGPKLYYAIPTGSHLASDIKISDDPSDWDADTFPPDWGGGAGISFTPDRVYSHVRVQYKSGAVKVNNATTESNFRRRETTLFNSSVKNSTRAAELANKFLDKAAAEDQIITVRLHLPADRVNDVRAGMRIQVKSEHLGLTDFTWFRITRRTIEADGNDVSYLVSLEFYVNPVATRFSTPRVEWGEHSNTNDDGATVIIDENGITVLDGAISVSNAGDTVIIDGTSDMFRIVASGTVTVAKNTSKGDMYKVFDVDAGLTYNPATLWYVNVQDGNGKVWAYLCTRILHNTSGQIVDYFGGMARHIGSGVTRVRAIKGTTKPPLKAQVFRFYVLHQTAI